jgi:N-acetylmuramoyl-L-alanine amidase
MPIQITVRQGDCLTKIAARFGFSDYRVIYNHPDNAEFKKHRPNPDVIFPGDVLVIPDKEEKSVDVPAGKTHRFQVKRPPKRVLRIAFRTSDDKPLANAGYTLTFGETEVEGETDGDGVLEEEVPHDLDRATLLIDGAEHELQVGSLNPVASAPDAGVSGAKARLANLGYDAPQVDGTMDFATAAALAAFQRDHGLDPSGELDDATRKKLESAHGC